MTDLLSSTMSLVLVGMDNAKFCDHWAAQYNLPAYDRRPLISGDRSERYRVIAFANDDNADAAIAAFAAGDEPATGIEPDDLFTVVRDASGIENGEQDPQAACEVEKAIARADDIIERSQAEEVIERLKSAKSALAACICLNEIHAIAKQSKSHCDGDHLLLAYGVDLVEMSWSVEFPDPCPDSVAVVHDDGNAILYCPEMLLDDGPWTYAPVKELIGN